MKKALLLLALLASPLSAQVLVPKITVSPKTATVAIGTVKRLSRTVTVVWTSSDPTIATVSSTGDVTPLRQGVVTISVTSGGGVVATSVITVPPPAVAAITVTLDKNKLVVSETTQAHATLWDARGNIILVQTSIVRTQRYAFDWVIFPDKPWQHSGR